MPIESLYDLNFKALQARLEVDGVRPVHAVQLWKILYHELEMDPAARSDLSPPLERWLRRVLEGSLTLARPSVSDRLDSSDGLTKKLLLRLYDGQEIETVVMGYPGRFTACISSQAGCAMGCVFCATGQMGFVRHLSHGEIVTQVIEAQRLHGQARQRADDSKMRRRRQCSKLGQGPPAGPRVERHADL